MTRTTIKTLRSLIDQLNTMTGNPTQVWTSTPEGSKAHVGCYVLDAAYGGYRLCQIVSEGGGERDITGRESARVCADQIRAYMRGIEVGKESN